MKTWIATYYDNKDNVIHTETFNDRTEHEAFNEAEALMPELCEDWTLIEANK